MLSRFGFAFQPGDGLAGIYGKKIRLVFIFIAEPSFALATTEGR